jgi:hypothetical protein
LDGQGIELARRLALYARSAIAALAGFDEATLQNISRQNISRQELSQIESWKFPAPTGVATGLVPQGLST